MSSVTFPPAVGGDGSTVSDDANPSTGLANGGHRTRFVPSLAQIVAIAQNVVTNATNADADAAAAAADRATVVSLYDQFDDRYLGSKTSDPTLDNDGNALLTGAIYWNSSTNQLKVWSGSAWILQSFVPTAASGVSFTPTGNIAAATVQAAIAELDTEKAASLPITIVSGTTQAAAAFNHYVLVNVAATTVTLPASPAAGDIIVITVANDLTTNVIARNAKSIQGLAEDMTIDLKNATVRLSYIDATRMWRII